MIADFLANHALLSAGVLIAGFAAGFAGGLFGIGGGIITVPALYAVFQTLGVGDDQSLKSAVATSLGVIVVSSIRSLATHHRAGHVDGEILRSWGPWIALGSVFGGFIAKWAPVEALAIVFAGGAFYIAGRRIFGGRKGKKTSANLLSKRMKIPIGVGTGVFSSLMGLGGGAVGVMIMTIAGRSMHQAIATSAGFGVAVAVPGVLAFIVSGWAVEGLPPGSVGYLNAPAFLAMAVMAAISAPLGARLAHRLNGDLLSKIFGAYVFCAASALLWDVFF